MKRPNRIVLGITGGIATGKSTVLSLFKQHGAATLSSDDLAHRALLKGHPAYARVVRAFGSEILDGKARIDRHRLGALVFSSPQARRRLERIVHPYVIAELRRFPRGKSGLVALDIPLLYEAGLSGLVDCVVVVGSARSKQLSRMAVRDDLSRTDSLRRIRAQWPLKRKVARGDFVVMNDGSIPSLRRAVGEIIHHLQGAQARARLQPRAGKRS